VQTREDLKNCIRLFLQREELQKSPPQGVLIEYSGHVIQKDGNVYLLPGNSNPEDKVFDPTMMPSPSETSSDFVTQIWMTMQPEKRVKKSVSS